MSTVKKTRIKFTDICPTEQAQRVDAILDQNGWQLEHWVYEDGAEGYQLFFGDGVQVDNNYEYGFPYLVDVDECVHRLL